MPDNPKASGPLAVPMHRLAESVAESPTFRARAGLAANDADAAEKLIYGNLGGKKHIWYPLVSGSPSAGSLRSRMPLAVISRPGGWKATARSGGARTYLRPAGRLLLTLADVDRAGAVQDGDYETSMRDFDNFAGGVLADLMEHSGEDDGLNIVAIEEELPPAIPMEEEEAAAGGAFWLAQYAIDWS